jgi:hypothetical protein
MLRSSVASTLPELQRTVQLPDGWPRSVVYRFPHCEVTVDEAQRYVETRFADGAKVGSTPNNDDWTMHIAAQLGYGSDSWTMSKDHEVAHTWMAHELGRPWSATMWRLAHPRAADSIGDNEVSDEESAVLEFQRLLDKAAPRPWDTALVPTKGVLRW